MSYDTPSPETESTGDALDEQVDEHGAPTDDALPETEPTDPNPLVENDG